MRRSKKLRHIDLIDAAHVAKLREAGEPLFGLGNCYITPAVRAFLATHGRLPNSLLGPHCHGDFGLLKPEEVEANERGLLDGGQLLSCHAVEGRRIYVVTSEATDEGMRWVTVMLFVEEI